MIFYCFKCSIVLVETVLNIKMSFKIYDKSITRDECDIIIICIISYYTVLNSCFCTIHPPVCTARVHDRDGRAVLQYYYTRLARSKSFMGLTRNSLIFCYPTNRSIHLTYPSFASAEVDWPPQPNNASITIAYSDPAVALSRPHRTHKLLYV